MSRPKLKISMDEATRRAVEQRYKATKDSREKERLLAIRLAAKGQYSFTELAQEVGRSRSLLQIWIDRFEAGGIEALLAKGTHLGKSSPLADEQIQNSLREGLREGKWRTAPQVQRWLEQTHGIKRAVTTVYYWLGKVGGALKVPRPVHHKKNEALSGEFIEQIEARLENLKLSGPVKLWMVDESRYGLHSVQRRCWSLRGHRVVLPHQQDYQWGYVYGALEIGSGSAEFLYTPTVNLEWSQAFIDQIKASDPHATHVVIWDQAGFHPKQAQLQGVHLLSLPPYSPELNPIEQLWDIVQDQICNRVFATLEKLEEALTEAFAPYWTQASRVVSLLGHHPLVHRVNAS